MKQILQRLGRGGTEVADVPCPAVATGQLLIRSSRTLVSAGTERMLVEFAKAGWIDKVRQQPDKVRMVLDKIRTDGLLPTIEAVFNKLDQPLPVGYCNVGVVMDAGPGVTGFVVGDRVVSNGKHAEVVSVPMNLCARVPQEVGDDEAAFTVVAAVGLQGIRLVQPSLGEGVVVIGLGLIGLITVQLLRAHGCRVLGVDFDRDKLELARRFGAQVVDLSAGEDPVTLARQFSRGRGVDAAIITAATKSSEPVHQAALMCRKRARIVLVGVTGLELSRADFYEKELTFQVSCSYGPGRYDPEYEERGRDYPVGFVRWTEQRNFEAVLDMMAEGRIDVKPLVSHRFSVAKAAEAYDTMVGPTPSLGILFEYASTSETSDGELRRTTLALRAPEAGTGLAPAVGFIGSGNYATATLIPAFKNAGARLKTVASSGGMSGMHAARKFGFEEATTDSSAIFADPQIDCVVIATRHDSHARLVCAALAANKHVFVEKPLALTHTELADIEQARDHAIARGRDLRVVVGFNRRYAPHVQKAKSLLAGVGEPKAMIMTVNAGALPPEHWTQHREVGGGRIIGEACHFIDLLRFLAGAPVTSVQAAALGAGGRPSEDRASVTLTFADGSIGTVLYLANGHKSFPKERLEVFAGGRILQLDNFRVMRGYGWSGFDTMKLWRQDKGQGAFAAAFVQAVSQGAGSLPSFEEILEVSRVTIEAAELLRSGDA